MIGWSTRAHTHTHTKITHWSDCRWQCFQNSMRISTATSDIHKSADYHCIVTTIVGYLYLGTRGICGSDAVPSSEWGYIMVTQYSSTWYCWDVCTLLITLLKWAVSSRDESSVTTWSDREEKEVKEEREREIGEIGKEEGRGEGRGGKRGMVD